MPNELWIAGAGSGKTNKIITEAINVIKGGGRVLVVTYTINNQAELRARFVKEFGSTSEYFLVKGLFSFYLDDMIRPYQRAIFPDRITSIFFTERNPHLAPGSTYSIPGRAEELENKITNPLHYLTSCKTMAYSGLLAKLATRISNKTKNAPARRLKEIYQKIFFDEVQDLIGWDYEVIKFLNKVMVNSICCVGDFRQTIYNTTFGQKKPDAPPDKINYFVNKLRFEKYTMPTNRRCIQEICDLSDTTHSGMYEKTLSEVTDIPREYSHHYGVFIVMGSQLNDYLAAFQPQILRWSSSTGTKYLPRNVSCYTFGSSKGLGFDRVLIILSDKHLKFISGDTTIFDRDKTDASRNKLYVAITRARYSLAFLVEDEFVKGLPYPVWKDVNTHAEVEEKPVVDYV